MKDEGQPSAAKSSWEQVPQIIFEELLEVPKVDLKINAAYENRSQQLLSSWVLENFPQTLETKPSGDGPMVNPTGVCGVATGLVAHGRHRRFEVSFP